MTSQIKTKERVANHGEVFTAEREVRAMLDLVKNELERIESRFLEPACGDGNFLAPILDQKLDLIRRRYRKSRLEFERYAIVAVGSIYGLDILLDNVMRCRDRLYERVNKMYSALYKDSGTDEFRKAIKFILDKNIIHGDALTLMSVTKDNEPVTFSEWSMAKGSMMKRRDFTFEEILQKEKSAVGLFEAMAVDRTEDPYFLPEPLKEYPLVHYLQIPYEN